MAVEIPLALLLAAVAGAGLNVARGALNKPKDKFSVRKAFGGLIGAVFGAIAAVQLIDPTAVVGIVGLVVLGLITGFTSDFALSKLKK